MKFSTLSLSLLVSLCSTLSYPILNSYIDAGTQQAYILPDVDSNIMYESSSKPLIAIFSKNSLQKIDKLSTPLKRIKSIAHSQNEIFNSLIEYSELLKKEGKIATGFYGASKSEEELALDAAYNSTMTFGIKSITASLDEAVVYMQEMVFPTIQNIATNCGATQIMFVEDSNHVPQMIDVADLSSPLTAKLFVKHNFLSCNPVIDITNLVTNALNQANA